MKCNTCKTDIACAATLYLHSGTYYILAHYGSRFDMQRYAMKRGVYDVGHICDDCVEKYINEGKAQLIEDGVW